MTSRTSAFVAFVLILLSGMPMTAYAVSDGYTLCAVRGGQCMCRPVDADAGVLVVMDPARCRPSQEEIDAAAAAEAAAAAAAQQTAPANGKNGKKAAAADKAAAANTTKAVKAAAPAIAAPVAPIATVNTTIPAGSTPAVAAATPDVPAAPATDGVPATPEAPKNLLNPLNWLPALQAVGSSIVAPPAPAPATDPAAYKLCAHRGGTCTCQKASDGPGEYTPVDETLCTPPAPPPVVVVEEPKPTTDKKKKSNKSAKAGTGTPAANKQTKQPNAAAPSQLAAPAPGIAPAPAAQAPATTITATPSEGAYVIRRDGLLSAPVYPTRP